MTRILVTGATGNVGRTVTSLLAIRPDVRVRALTRDAGAAALLLPGSVEVAVGDFGDRASLDAALDRVDTVFLACANVPSQVDHESLLIDRAAAAGVRRLVKLSAPGSADRAPRSRSGTGTPSSSSISPRPAYPLSSSSRASSCPT